MNAQICRKNLSINDSKTEITGNTYPVKDWIKAKLDGTWNKDKQAWIVNPEKVEYWIGCGGITIMPDVHTYTPTTTKVNNGLCPKCGTYCYGDCMAH